LIIALWSLAAGKRGILVPAGLAQDIYTEFI